MSRASLATRSFAIVDRVPAVADRSALNEVLLVCPWLQGLSPDTGLWVSVLPIHDSNAYVEKDWCFDAPSELRSKCYFGIFSLDRLREPKQLLTCLRRRGVEKLINLPSVSFFDATTARTFDMLGFTPEMECAFLKQAWEAGFGVAFCARAGTELSVEERSYFDFVLTHAGAAGELTIVETSA